MIEATGTITNIQDGKGFYVFVPYSDTDEIEFNRIKSVDISLLDNKSITNDQRRKIFALINDITAFISAPKGSQWTRAYENTLKEMRLLRLMDSVDSEQVRRAMSLHYCELRDKAPISLSTLDRTTASDFIDWLIEQCIVHGIPCIDTLLNRCEDIERYLYTCVANRSCAVCGAYADIHHYDHIGMGRNRSEVVHLGLRVQPLCREHHNECHNQGQSTFDRYRNLSNIALDENLCDILGLRKR